MHPEMMAIYGSPTYEPLAPDPAEQRAADVRQTAAAAVARQVADVISAFVAAATAAKIPLVTPDSGIVEVKSLRYATAFRRRGAPVAHGWFVNTPAHQGAVVHRDTSQAQTAITARLGLAVSDQGAVFAALPPNCFEIELRGGDIRGDVLALGGHTHGGRKLSAEQVREIPNRLRALFELALANPVELAARITRREYRRAVKDTLSYRDEKIFGPGGLKAYRQRMYGK
jgi:hypothetical protein